MKDVELIALTEATTRRVVTDQLRAMEAEIADITVGMVLTVIEPLYASNEKLHDKVQCAIHDEIKRIFASLGGGH
jgi:hypothetical protein